MYISALIIVTQSILMLLEFSMRKYHCHLIICRHPVTGEEMSINDAMERGFLTGDQAGEYITSKAVKETRSFTITGALDPNTGRKVSTTHGVY